MSSDEYIKARGEVERDMKASGKYINFYSEYSSGYWEQERRISEMAADKIAERKAIETLKRLKRF